MNYTLVTEMIMKLYLIEVFIHMHQRALAPLEYMSSLITITSSASSSCLSSSVQRKRSLHTVLYTLLRIGRSLEGIDDSAARIVRDLMIHHPDSSSGYPGTRLD